MILIAKIEKEGMLKDLDEIKSLTEKLTRKVNDMRLKITLEESAEEDPTAGSK